ncbi:hypothetical protein Kpol_1043p25 [Vanderwaltozyma polyspora DSM 70294]|uniref:B30.2/SPRY domain-containing protein n=1 Tax=Vanderwaltozyma polyspora (strain ATCC 22028 / DSM 70294 / BCRC 21397 / CBS 2163 / NBRC 10782 / NRRL Y-8283 / UCD 57-17) TaxID=436907 RepID=A7TIP3_VANPO|nr:uncharacterized protein Kpol_1043p25 [Vanderwaltozyma polyspora DSM 70294]EDO17835.1 hypothetical protein Kpol_1043p25 [Vanderwaltozyma polyspora DSM 70294]
MNSFGLVSLALVFLGLQNNVNVNAMVIKIGDEPVINSRDNQFNERPTDYEFDKIDRDLMIFSFIFMVVIYICLSLIFIAIRFVITRIVTRHARISLLADDLENNRRPSHRRRNTEEMLSRWPNILDDESEIGPRLSKLSPEEQFYYKQGEEYIKQNPPLIIPHSGSNSNDIVDPIINDETLQFIEEEGAHAWEFQPDPNLPNDAIIVDNKTELTFLNYDFDVSVSTNLPIPRINRVYYCEFKIYEINNDTSSSSNSLNDDEVISFGLSTSPYPYFRLPGRHHHSIAYDSTGGRRFNDSFELEPELASLFPRCERGDVIGIGYRSNSGTVFFTRNGKKLNEKSVGGHIRGWKFKYLYPIVGANVPCKIHVNFGTYGFVFIEANVKKWGYSKPNGLKLPPPSYEEYGHDTLLESGGEDEGSDLDSLSSLTDNLLTNSTGDLLPPPPGFEYSTSPNAYSTNEEITLHTYPVEPPSYSDGEVDGSTNPRVETFNEERTYSDTTALLHDDTNEDNYESEIDDEREYDEMDEIDEMDNTRENTFNNQFID